MLYKASKSLISDPLIGQHLNNAEATPIVELLDPLICNQWRSIMYAVEATASS